MYINVFIEGSTKVYEFSHQVKIALNFNLFGFGHFSVLAHSLYITDSFKNQNYLFAHTFKHEVVSDVYTFPETTFGFRNGFRSVMAIYNLWSGDICQIYQIDYF